MPTSDPSYLFTIRFKLSSGTVTMRAWEVFPFLPNGDRNPAFRDNDSHTRIDCELYHGGNVVFPRGSTWCGMPRGSSLDGNEAKELVASLFAMRPGDTDREYFDSYTPEQLAWAEANGEELGIEREIRYCDENGAVRK